MLSIRNVSRFRLVEEGGIGFDAKTAVIERVLRVTAGLKA